MISWNNVSLLVEIKLLGRIGGLELSKTELKLGFSPFSQVFPVSFYLNCTEVSLEQCLTTSRGKTYKKFGEPHS